METEVAKTVMVKAEGGREKERRRRETKREGVEERGGRKPKKERMMEMKRIAKE